MAVVQPLCMSTQPVLRYSSRTRIRERDELHVLCRYAGRCRQGIVAGRPLLRGVLVKIRQTGIRRQYEYLALAERLLIIIHN